MKPLRSKDVKVRPATLLPLLLCALVLIALPAALWAQPIRIDRPGGMPPGFTPPSEPTPSSGSRPDSGGKEGGAWIPSEPVSSDTTSTNATGSSTNSTDEVQLSFQGANIDMVVKWLSETTGKSVIKHPQVQCQLTITSSKKVSKREAITLVYQALGLEGFTAIEFAHSILIVPEAKEPRMSPQLLDGSEKGVPEGRQRLTKVFPLKYIQAADLKERIRAALSDKASVDLDERANQIIITDYNDNIRVVGDLIEALDMDRPEDLTVRVISLKNVPAIDLAKAIIPLYQKRSSKSPKDMVEVTADEQSNSLLVLSSEANFRNIQRFVAGLDTEDAQDKIMRTFTLKNADAQDVAKQLQDLNQDQGGGGPLRYIYVYGGQSSSGKSKKMNVVSDRRRNAVIVQAPPSQMEGIAKMIAELDEPVDDESLAPKIYPLKYVSAVDIENVLNELFLKRQQQRSYYDYIFGDDSSSSTADRDVGRLYGKVRITSEPYSNTIIVTSNSKENLAVVEEVLNQLDTPSQAGESTLRVELKFAKSADVANNLNILFAKNGAPPLRPTTQQQQGAPGNQQQQQQQPTGSSQNGFSLEQETKEEGYYPWLGGQPDSANRSADGRNTTRPVSDLVGRVRVVADQRGGALLVSANMHLLPQVLKLIGDMDVPLDQVLIEARIVEVSSDFLDKLGVRWSPDGKQVFSQDDYENSFLAHSGAEYQKGFGGSTRVNSPAFSSGSAAQIVRSLQSGVVDNTINVDFLVQFLRKTANATVLGAPHLSVADNETAKLFVGQRVPFISRSQNTDVGALNQTFEYQDVGVILEVTPHINSSGDVALKVHAESSAVVPGQTILGGAVLDTRNFRTDLTAKDGQTLVLGGIIQRQVSDVLRKTPILGDIPGVGWLFKKKDKSTREVELMVFLRPKVVRSPEDARELMKEIDRKAPLLKKWQEDSNPETKSDKKGKSK